MAQLVALATGSRDDPASETGWVRVEVWLEWLLGAYAESKRNAATLFEMLYDRCVLLICVVCVCTTVVYAGVNSSQLSLQIFRLCVRLCVR